ncbi:MAG: hypothetical protein ACT4OS_11670 [Acidimicrobiales bacterium]
MASRENRANNSPVVVADPGDPTFLVLANRLDAPDYSCAMHVSGDAGQSWTPVTPIAALPDGVDKCYSPEVAIDGRGRVHFLFLGLAGDGNLPVGGYLTTSEDRGRTFSAPRQVLEGVNFAARMAVDPTRGQGGRIHIAWLRAGAPPGLGSLGTSDNPILAMYSDDGGETFSEPVRVSDPKRPRSVAPALALGPDGAVHIAYYDLLDDARDYQGLDGPVWEGNWQLVLASSFNGGMRFGAGAVVEPEVVPHERVMVIFTMPPAALAVGGDQVCLSWTDARHGDADVLARCSADRGRTWAGAERVNDDPLATGRWQYLPRLGIAPGGRIDAVFYDRRDDPENVANDVSYAFSTDGGRTFSPRLKLNTTGSSSSLIGQQYAVPSAGDRYDFGFRIALLSRPDDLFTAWADTHLSAPDTMSQDILATTVTPPPAGGGFLGRGWWVTSSLVAAIAALVGMGLWWRRRRAADAAPMPEEPAEVAS